MVWLIAGGVLVVVVVVVAVIVWFSVASLSEVAVDLESETDR